MLNKHCIFLFFRGHPKITLRCFEGAPFCLSLESKARRMACLFHTSGKMVPPSILPLRHDKRSLTARGRAKCALPKARFWRGALSSRARSAVSRDGCRRFIRLHRALPLTFYADSWGPKITASNQNARVCLQTVRPFLSRDFRFSPRGGSRVGGSCFVLLIVALV